MSSTRRNKGPAFMMRHYGSNLPRSALLDPLREKLRHEQTVEFDYQDAEARVAAWIEENENAVHRGTKE